MPDGAGLVLIGPSAEAVQVGDRPCKRLAAEPAEAAVEEAEAACAAGARFVVLLHPDRPAEALNGKLRRRFLDSMRPITAQRLAEVFEARNA